MKLPPVWYCSYCTSETYPLIANKRRKKKDGTTSNLLPLQKLQLHKCSLVKPPECMQFANSISPKST